MLTDGVEDASIAIYENVQVFAKSRPAARDGPVAVAVVGFRTRFSKYSVCSSLVFS